MKSIIAIKYDSIIDEEHKKKIKNEREKLIQKSILTIQDRLNWRRNYDDIGY